MTVWRNRWGRRVLIALMLTIAVLTTFGFWALSTQSGARQLVRLAVEQVDADLTVSEVKGSLVDGLTLSQVRYGSPGVNVTLESVGLTLEATRLIRSELSLTRLEIVGVRIVANDEDQSLPGTTDGQSELPEIDLPVDIYLQNLTIKDIEIGSRDSEPTRIVDRMSARVRWVNTLLEVTNLSVRSPFGNASASATVRTADAYPIQLHLTSTLSIAELAPVNSTTTLDGTLRQLNVVHVSEAPYSITLSGEVTDTLSKPDLNVEVQSSGTRLGAIRSDLPGIEFNGTANLSGFPDSLGIRGSLIGLIPDVGDTELSVAATLSGPVIELQESVIRLPEGEVPTEITLRGNVNLGPTKPDVDLTTQWSDLKWPLRGEALLQSKQGTGSLRGSLDEYSVSVRGDLATQYDSEGQLELSMQGDTERLRVNSLRAETLGGSITGNANLNMDETRSFSARLQGSGLDPQGLNTNWPGSLDFELEGHGTAVDSAFAAELTTFTGTGMLRGYPVNFDGRGKVAPDKWSVNDFVLRTGETTINLSGELAESINLEWDANSADLNSLWPGLSGTLDTSGRATGSASAPVVSVSLDASELSYENLAIAELDATVKFDATDQTSSTAVIEATDLRAENYRAEQVTINAGGTIAEHALSFEVQDALGQSRMRIEGAVEEPRRYSFNVTSLIHNSTEFGEWSLDQQASGLVSDSHLTLSQTCLARSDSTLCVKIDSVPESQSADVRVSNLPLSMITHVMPSAIHAEGRVNGGGQLMLLDDGTSTGDLRFDFEPLSIESAITSEDGRSTLEFAPSSIMARAGQSGELELTAAFPLKSGGGLNLEGAVLPSDRAFREREIVGSLSLSVPSISFVRDYIEQVGSAEGEIQGNINLSGSVQRPQLIGRLAVEQVAFTLTEPGVEATDVSVELTGKQDNSFTLNGSARSGEGTLSISGAMKFLEEGNNGEFSLIGSDFQVANTQTAKIWASPDVLLSYENNELKLTGSVAIPTATVDIDELPQGVIKASRDQIIVGQSEGEDPAMIPVDADLQLELGDNVSLSAFGLDAGLKGGIRIRQLDGKPATANGEIELIDGEYWAYGQQLTITTGRLVYVGGSIDSPGIDLRAIRKPTPEIEVGVSARGSISQPEFSVFSTPAMSESDQLAYLIFGRPINAEAASESSLITRAALTLGMRGGDALTQKLADELGVDQLGIESEGSSDLSQASLVIGKYLSPRLFVSYGIGLLEPVSTLKLEYALSSKWQLISESSTTRNSADVQYTIER